MASAPYVQNICDRLIANSLLPFKALKINLLQIEHDEDLKTIFKALRKNTTVTVLTLYYARGFDEEQGLGHLLTYSAALSLCAAVSGHSSLEELSFEFLEFEEFTPIVAAFEFGGDKLSRLALSDCFVTPEDSQYLSDLLENDTIESLAISFCRYSDRQPLDLSQALAANQSLRSLNIEEGFPPNTLTRAIPRMLSENDKIHTLQICFHDREGNIEMLEPTFLSTAVSAFAAAAAGHPSLRKLFIRFILYYDEQRGYLDGLDEVAARNVGFMLATTPELQEFQLTGCALGPQTVRHVLNGVRSENCGLQSLNLSGNNIDLGGGILLANFLENNTRLKGLKVDICGLGDRGVAAIAAALAQNNSSLEELSMYFNHIEIEGAGRIADMLAANTVLKALDISFNQMTDDAIALIASSFQHNSSLKTIDLNSNDTSHVGAEAIANGLRANTSLEHVEFSSDSEAGIRHMMEMLCAHRTLKSLVLLSNKESCHNIVSYFLPDLYIKSLKICSPDELSEVAVERYGEALRKNSKLEKFDVCVSGTESSLVAAIRPQIDAVLTRNIEMRCVRGTLENDNWPDSLAAVGLSRLSSIDSAHVFLREKPAIISSSGIIK